jgi:hypothetical protein
MIPSPGEVTFRQAVFTVTLVYGLICYALGVVVGLFLG